MAVDYCKSHVKAGARRELVRICREEYGVDHASEYWCLAGRQEDVPGSEINQLVDLGFVRPSRFHGVDRDRFATAMNRHDHPDANWHHGEWLGVIRSPDFTPEVVHLDTTSVASNPDLWYMVAQTMAWCPVGTILFVNIMMSNPYSGERFDHAEFLSGLEDEADLDSWVIRGKMSGYRHGKTDMGFFAFRRVS